MQFPAHDPIAGEATEESVSGEARAASGKAPLSVARVLQILKVLSQSDTPLGLAELSRRLATPKTSLIGLLRGLVDMNFVVFADGTYRLGGSTFELASAVLSSRQRLHMNDYIQAGMNDLNRQSGETVFFAVLGSDEPAMLTYVSMVESRKTIRISVGIGDRSPLYCTAGGRIFLAAMPDAEVRRYLATAPIQSFGTSTVTDPRQLFALVQQARQDQFSCVRDEMVQGITGMAAPVRDSSGETIGALIVAGPTSRMIEDEPQLRAMVLQAAQGVSLSLGYDGTAGSAA